MCITDRTISEKVVWKNKSICITFFFIFMPIKQSKNINVRSVTSGVVLATNITFNLMEETA